MFEIEYTKQFIRDIKRAKKQQKNILLLQKLMEKIRSRVAIPLKFRDHPLRDNWAKHRELHIDPDWLLIYKILLSEKIVIFVRVGSHSELFS